MGKARVSEVEKVKLHYYDAKCNYCDRIVRLSCEHELTEAHRDEVQKRLLCVACSKRKLDAKK